MRVSLLLLALLGGSGCPGTSGGSAPLPSAELRRKLLDYQQVKFPQRQFVVGLGAGATLELATATAFGEITRQLTWLPAGSQDLLRGMYRIERSATDEGGQVQALATLERDAANSHLRRLAREAEQAAAGRLPECEKSLGAGELDAAERCLAQGAAELARAADLFAAARAAVGDQALRAPLEPEARYAELRRRVSSSRTDRGSVMVAVQRVIDGRAAGDLSGEFARVVTDSGLKRADGTAASLSGAALLKAARQAGAGYVIVGKVQGRFSSEDSGQYFSFAEGALRLLETVSGKVLAELSCSDVKGGHISREKATEKAVREAVSQLGAQLGGKLRALPR